MCQCGFWPKIPISGGQSELDLTMLKNHEIGPKNAKMALFSYFQLRHLKTTLFWSPESFFMVFWPFQSLFFAKTAKIPNFTLIG